MKRFTNLSVNSHFFSLNKRLVGQLNWKLRPPFYGKKCHSLLFESPQLLQWKYSVKNISYLYKARKFIEFYILEFVYAAWKIFTLDAAVTFFPATILQQFVANLLENVRCEKKNFEY